MAAQALALLSFPQRATAMRMELALHSQLGAPGVPERVAGILRSLGTFVSRSQAVEGTQRVARP